MSSNDNKSCKEDCPWCDMGAVHPYSGPPIPMTTVCICADGKVYNLGEGEYPPQPPGDGTIREDKHRVINAYSCTIEDAKKLKKKNKKK